MTGNFAGHLIKGEITMDDYDRNHFSMPRRDMTPGYLHAPDEREPRLRPYLWIILAAVLAFCVTMLVATDCGQPWCW